MGTFEKKKFAERTPFEKAIVGVLLLVSVAIVGFAERDLQRRPEQQVRGNKLVWRLTSLNAFGALAYLGLGRR
jgi:hypothetical protein